MSTWEGSLSYHWLVYFPASGSGCLRDNFQRLYIRIEYSVERQRLGAEYQGERQVITSKKSTSMLMLLVIFKLEENWRNAVEWTMKAETTIPQSSSSMQGCVPWPTSGFKRERVWGRAFGENSVPCSYSLARYRVTVGDSGLLSCVPCYMCKVNISGAVSNNCADFKKKHFHWSPNFPCWFQRDYKRENVQ